MEIIIYLFLLRLPPLNGALQITFYHVVNPHALIDDVQRRAWP
jgi:hypothetical protein